MRNGDSDTRRLLVIEDEDTYIDLFKRYVDQSNGPVHLIVRRDGRSAINFLENVAHKKLTPPDLITLDLQLPRADGLEVLSFVKKHPHLRCIPVVVLSNSREEETIQRCYELCANSYVQKPPTLALWRGLIGSLESFWLGIASLPSHLAEGTSKPDLGR